MIQRKKAEAAAAAAAAAAVADETTGATQEPEAELSQEGSIPPCNFGTAEPSKRHKQRESTSKGLRGPKKNALLNSAPIDKKEWDERVLNQAWIRPAIHEGEEPIKYPNMIGWTAPFSLRPYAGLEGLYIFCSACKGFVAKKYLKQHMGQAKHHKNVEKAEVVKQKNQQTLDAVVKVNGTKPSTGSNLSKELEAWRIKVMQATFKAGMSIGQLHIFTKALASDFRDGLTFGNARNNAQKYTEMVMNIEKDRLRELTKQCYPEFATISDGTPKSKKFEAIKIRMVRISDGAILENLVHIKTHDKSIKAEDLALNFYDCITEYGLNFKNWLFAVVDRAGTNKRCIDLVCDDADLGANPTASFCDSHGIVKPGEVMAKHATHFESFRQKWNAAIQYATSSASKYVKRLINVAPQRASGVRWWVRWEQAVEINKIGIEIIAGNIATHCINKGWSTNSFQSIQQIATPEKIPIILVEGAALLDAGKVFCNATYILEGDDPLILSAYLVHEMVRERIDELRNGLNMEKTLNACKRAEMKIAILVQPLKEAEEKATMELTMAKLALREAEVARDQAKVNLERLRNHTQGEEDGPSNKRQRVSERKAKRTGKGEEYRANNASPEERNLMETLKVQETKVCDCLKTVSEKQEAVDQAAVDLGNFVPPMNLRTKEDFLQYAKSKVIEPAIQEYKRLFQESNGDYFAKTCAEDFCKILDPLWLQEHGNEELMHLFIDQKLPHFGFHFVDTLFIDQLKRECKRLLHVAKEKVIDLDKVDVESSNYLKRVNARRLREAKDEAYRHKDPDDDEEEKKEDADALNDDDDVDPFDDDVDDIIVIQEPTRDHRNPRFDEWKKDPGERARRTWIWWNKIFKLEVGSLENFWRIVRCVVLNQSSSASVERVFSQLNCICRTIGVNAVDETVAARLMMRVNNKEEE